MRFSVTVVIDRQVKKSMFSDWYLIQYCDYVFIVLHLQYLPGLDQGNGNSHFIYLKIEVLAYHYLSYKIFEK